MIRIKDNTVSIKGLKVEMIFALAVLEGVFDSYALPTVITAGTEGQVGDGVHMDTSKHYYGEALDIRKRQVPKSALATFVAKMRKHLGSDFEVIAHKTHFHIETSG